ncbi:MAG: hypothetical protein GY799_19140 [Desulfobulbaceae bacterium]|nr:hypothetical protein [Desulfobulbaceae bacterium]
MKKIIVLHIVIVLQLFLQSGTPYAADFNAHSAYKVTSYNLGAIKDLPGNAALSQSSDFNPLLITNTTADVLNSEHQRTVSLDDTAPDSFNLNSIALSAQFDATKNISLQGTFGVTRNLWTPDLMGSVDGSSWEANLGVIYKLLNNLSYELHFGYMDTGDLFNDRSSYSDVENIIMISNQLSLSF